MMSLLFVMQAMSSLWLSTWVAAPQLVEPGNMPPAPGFADATLRQVVHLTVGGQRIRLRFSNAFGTAPLSLNEVRVSHLKQGGTVDTQSEQTILFQGKGNVTIPAGALVVSDATTFNAGNLSDLVVTLRVKDPSKNITGHPGSRATSFLFAGDAMNEPTVDRAVKVTHWYYLSGVEVDSKRGAAVAVIGDSLTDGRGTTTDGNTRWTDVLAKRVVGKDLAVLNLGLGGNRVLHDGLGPSTLSRLDRDVLAQSGVRWLVLFEGINDLGTAAKGTHAQVAQELIAGYQQIIWRAQARGIKVYGGTITPCGESFYFSPELEAARQTVNEWVRTKGHFDAVVDFDAVLRDPKKSACLQSIYDSGDHLHLNDAGYKAIGEAVDLGLFRR